MQNHAQPQVITAAVKPSVRRLARLTWTLALGDLRRQYVGSFLGVVWTVLKPLLELLTYTFVFTVLLRVRFDPHTSTVVSALFLFCGWMVFVTVHETLSRSTTVIRDNSHLIWSVHVPAGVLPAYPAVSELLTQTLRVGLLMIAALIVGPGLSPWALLLPLVMLLQLVFTYGLALLISSLAVTYRDVRNLLQPALLIWMFVTPVFYPENVFPRQFLPVLVLNPLSHLIGMYRQILLNHQAPLPGQVLIFGLSSLAILALGSWVFHRRAPHFADLV